MTFNIHKWGMYLSIQFTKLLTYTLFKKLHWQLQCQPSTCSLAQKNELNGFLSSSGGGSGGGSRDQSWASPFPFYYHENKFSYYCKLVWQTLRGEYVCAQHSGVSSLLPLWVLRTEPSLSDLHLFHQTTMKLLIKATDSAPWPQRANKLARKTKIEASKCSLFLHSPTILTSVHWVARKKVQNMKNSRMIMYVDGVHVWDMWSHRSQRSTQVLFQRCYQPCWERVSVA